MFKNHMKKAYALIVLILCPVLFYVACSELIDNDNFAKEVKTFNDSILRFTDYTVNHLESIEFNQELFNNNGEKIGEINIQF